jgi:hypothetical protein
MKRIVKYPALLILSVTFLYAACDDGITPPPYDGPWEKVPVPDGIGCNNLWFTGPNDGWVTGGGTIGHYDGNEWKIVKDFDTGTEKYYLGDIIARSPTDVWTCGRAERAETDYNGFIAHYDGNDWEVQNFQNFGWLSALWFFNDGTGWAGGGYGLMRYDGTDWEFYEESYSVGKFHFNSKNEGWFITDFHVFEWDGTEWTEVLKTRDTWLYDIDFAAPDDGWAVGHLESYHYDGTEWKLYNPLYRKDFGAVHFLNDHFGWGGYGYAYFYDGESWVEIDDGAAYGYYDFFCVSEDDVWGCGPHGESYFMHFMGFD